ncbi:MAG: DUF3084 domain-containing protein [bacterium]
MFGVLLILVIAVMGGAVAYIGDKLGMKIGKKRLTVLGLRPKHTSILITIVTGIMIAGSTLLVLTLVSQDVRTALFGMEKLKQEMSYLNNKVKEKTAVVAETQKKYEQLAGQIGLKEKALSSVEKELSAVRQERDRQANLLARAEGDIASLEKTKKELDDKVAALEKSRALLTADVKEKEILARRLQLGLENMREGNIALQAGEELVRDVVQAKDDAEAKKELEKILAQAGRVASMRGAKAYTQHSPLIWISKNQYDEVIDRLVKSKGQMVVRLISVSNTVLNEPVAAGFQMFENKKIFQAGELLLTERIDGSEPESIIEARVFNMLRKINGLAIKKGMVPDFLQGTIGSISVKDVYQLVDEIKKKGQEITVVVTADKEIWTGDDLTIKARVRE